jgi:hypothetical protein
MRFFLKGFLASCLAVFILGLGLFLGQRPQAEMPPAIAERSLLPRPQAQDPFPSVEALAGPWFRRPPPAILPSLPKPKPAPAPVAEALRVDKASIIVLGSSKDRGGAPTYFFKYIPSGQVMILKPGETNKGWTLKAINDKSFTLSGSGGLYEVAR